MIVAGCALLGLIISVIIPITTYTTSIGTVAELEAFYNASSSNFEISRDDTASYLSEEKIQKSEGSLIPIYGSIERIGMGASAANRILEYRNTVNLYNTSFARYKAYSSNILFSIAYVPVPQGLKVLVINPVQNDSPNNYNFENQGNIGSTMPTQAPVPSTNTPGIQDQLNQIQNTLKVIEQAK
jgi:hypothetical protein